MATQEDDNGFEQEVIEVTDTSKLDSSPLGIT